MAIVGLNFCLCSLLPTSSQSPLPLSFCSSTFPPSFFSCFAEVFLYLWCCPTVRLESPDKEQLFLSGGHYVSRISEIMLETYALTRLDYLHSRSSTQGFKEFNLYANGLNITMRDVGGCELDQDCHWRGAILDSLCILFVVSLSDYTCSKNRRPTISKFQQIRLKLWHFLIDKTNPKIILLCNKQDLFRERLNEVPLHKGGKEFKNVHPQMEGENFEAYCKRCEEAVLSYFKKIPSSIRNSPEVKKRKEADSDFNIKHVRLSGMFVTQATDETLFVGVKSKLTQIFLNFLNNCCESIGM